MFGKKPTVIAPDLQRDLISKHLRYADELVRAKNYDGALEEIRKTLEIDPKHSLARSFQQRIMLIQKQNIKPQDNAPKETSPEEIMQSITHQFALAEQMISRHMYQEALKKIAEVYKIDPGNHFAKAYSDRIEQLIMEQEQNGGEVNQQVIEKTNEEPSRNSTVDKERGSIMMYEELMREIWFDGKVTQEEEEELLAVRETFNISMEEHVNLERKVKLRSYLEALKLAWKDGVVTEMERQVLEMMRRRYGISSEEHLSIEQSVQEAKKGMKPKSRILIVEPEKNQLVSLMRSLQARNFEVVMAGRAEDALQVMLREHPSLIVTEAVFPAGGLDGFGLFKKIQEHSALKGTPIFVMTDPKSQKLFHAALRLGFDLCLPKPVDVELLIAAIEGRLVLR